MNVHEFLNDCKVKVWQGTYSIVKATLIKGEYFAAISDFNEFTLIQKQEHVEVDNVIQEEKGWCVLSFDTTLPFQMIGFITSVSRELADKQISIFAMSAYSTEHILVKEHDLDKAVATLKELGCVVDFF
ncbi:MAG: ACT domain-containing protein [Bacteroidetes bacterium]|nr:ACT domain-containing protein [Bacteroidota bacterium]